MKARTIRTMDGGGRGERLLRFDTAWGPAWLTYRPAPFTIWRIRLPGTKPEPLPDTQDDAAHPSAALLVAQTLTDFFSGCRPMTVPEDWLALDRLTPKERAILRAARNIPYGTTRTYAQVASMAGFPRGARFAGNALHKNPFPVAVPCHRVVRSDGSLGGFAGGCKIKKKMIALEAASLGKEC